MDLKNHDKKQGKVEFFSYPVLYILLSPSKIIASTLLTLSRLIICKITVSIIFNKILNKKTFNVKDNITFTLLITDKLINLNVNALFEFNHKIICKPLLFLL